MTVVFSKHGPLKRRDEAPRDPRRTPILKAKKVPPAFRVMRFGRTRCRRANRIGEVGNLPTKLEPAAFEEFLPLDRVTAAPSLHEQVEKMVLKKPVGLDKARQHAHRSPAVAASESTDGDLPDNARKVPAVVPQSVKHAASAAMGTLFRRANQFLQCPSNVFLRRATHHVNDLHGRDSVRLPGEALG